MLGCRASIAKRVSAEIGKKPKPLPGIRKSVCSKIRILSHLGDGVSRNAPRKILKLIV
jgi:hypothetical protein